MSFGHVSLNYQQISQEGIRTAQSNIAIEFPVSLTVNGQIWLTFQCTPMDIEAMGIGFLFNEGFIRSMDEVENIHVCEQKDNLDIWLNHSVQKPETWRRTSGCHGGESSVIPERDLLEPVTNKALLNTAQIFDLLEQYLSEQLPHSESGGVHTSALADGATQLFQVYDIGRHNTFDKIAGRILINKLVIQTPVLISSGRISSDMLLKSVRMQAPFLISMRSTSQKGISLADQLGVTLIGGARRGRFNLFTHPERIHNI
jgi:FdhD protein